MKKNKFIIAGVLIAVTMLFSSLSCNKKDDVPKSAAVKEESRMTPEQAKKAEEIKKGIRESQNIVIATVNGADLTMYDLVKEMNAIAPKYVAAGQPTTPEITAKVKKEALDKLIFRELAVQEAIKEGMKVKPEAVEDVIKKVRAQAGSEENYTKYLLERSLDENGLRKSIERSHLLEMITAREIFDKIKVDDKTLRDRYEKDKALFVTKDNPPRQLAFEEVRDFIARKIKSEKGEKLIAALDSQLRKKTEIEIMPEKLK